MPKIENDAEKAPCQQKFVVQVSFDGLDKGDVFVQDDDPNGWAQKHVETGYLREVHDGEPGRND